MSESPNGWGEGKIKSLRYLVLQGNFYTFVALREKVALLPITKSSTPLGPAACPLPKMKQVFATSTIQTAQNQLIVYGATQTSL